MSSYHRQPCDTIATHRRLFKKMQAPKRPGFPEPKAGILHDVLEAKIGGQPVYMRDGNTGTVYRVQPKTGKPLCRILQGGW